MNESKEKNNRIIISANSCWNLVNFRIGLIEKLIKNNFKIYIVAPKDYTTFKLKKIGCIFYDIKIDRKKKNIFDVIKNIFFYFKIIKKINPSVFLAFTIKPNIYGSIVCSYLNINYVNNITGLGTTFLGNKVIKKIISLLYFIALRKSKMIFFQNKDDYKLFYEQKILNKNNFSKVIPGSGIEIKNLKNYKNNNKKIIFLFIGRLIKHKGIYELISAIKKVKKLNSNIDFHILGSNDKNNSYPVPDKLLHLWIKNKYIKYFGFKKNIKPFLNKADCVILPSYREGMSRALLEAALNYKPLIASNVPGCKDLVKNNINGFLCRPKDTNSLANAINKFILLSKKQKLLFGINSRKLVVKNFDQKIVINKYLQVIKNL